MSDAPSGGRQERRGAFSADRGPRRGPTTLGAGDPQDRRRWATASPRPRRDQARRRLCHPPPRHSARSVRSGRGRKPKGYTEVRIVGVGGGGGNAVNRMIEAGVSGVDFIAAEYRPPGVGALAGDAPDTPGRPHAPGASAPAAIPRSASAPPKIASPSWKTRLPGRTWSSSPPGWVGERARRATPVIAKIARNHKALTVGVVTLPFGFEGARRRRVADEGVGQLAGGGRCPDRDPKRSTAEPGRALYEHRAGLSPGRRYAAPRRAGYRRPGDRHRADQPGLRRRAHSHAGRRQRSDGHRRRERRRPRAQAARAVVASPLLEHSIDGASGILLNVTGGPDLTLHEVSEVAEFVTQATSRRTRT